MPLLLLLFLVAACTSSAPGRYQDGARLPPPEPTTTYAPAGAGLPEYFVPPEPEYPRSPHTRVLPPEKGPGLWAGDAPQASKGAVPKPVLLGVELPLPAGATSDEHSYPVRLCGQALSAAVAHLDIIPHGPRLPAGASRECAAAALLLQCLTEDLDEALKEKRKGSAMEPGLKDAYDKAQTMAWNFFSAKCGKRRTTQEEIDYYEHVLTEWRTLKRNVQ